ncbi:cytochrome c oxidase assembly protein [Pararhizobium haloflavum]|uniref:cytochrome c oxidase assembly protein n=1 Tax=Pararhizobium haloflavum TaxID=2037914 RepID=UPI000C182408|nr:cytochrome c oxidase assembly protein [Pararhizobium haloflavum]
MNRPALIAGLLALAIAWSLPLAQETSFTSHMLTHMGVVAIAAPLIGLGLAGTRLDLSDRVPMLFSPVVASVIDLVVVWAWHVPALRNLADTSAPAAIVEQATFLAAGLLLWLACLGGQTAGDRTARDGAGAFGLLLTSVHMTLLGALLALAPRALYGSGEVTCFGVTLTAETDQQLGGTVMLLLGAAVYLAGGVALLARVVKLTPHEGGAR